MSFVVPIGIFAAAVLGMAAILVLKHMRERRGFAASTPNAVSSRRVSGLFSRLHELERTLLSFSFRAGGHALRRSRSLIAKGTASLVERTPIKRLSGAVSGKPAVPPAKGKPSAYLKDMTEHKNNVRENRENGM